MNEVNARKRAQTESSRTSRFTERLPLLVVTMILGLTAVWGATAQAGSGGVGSGGDGSGDGDGNRYDRMWDNFSRKDKRWAHSTSECESGQRPKVHGGDGTYHGAFQFMLSTWRSAPKSPGGDPHRRNWKTQAVVAVKLKHRDGARTHWPNCG